MSQPEVPADALRENQAVGNFLLTICWLIGHDNKLPTAGHFLIECRRCKRNVHRAYWWQLIPSRIASGLVWLANYVFYRPWGIQEWGNGYHLINNIDFFSRQYLQSLVNQGDDMLLSKFLSDEGWIKLSDLKHEDGTPYTLEEQADLINESLTLEATRQKQEELNRHAD